MIESILLLTTSLIAALLCAVVRRRGSLDIPNDRSAHVMPVPTGGGIAVMSALALGVFAGGLVIAPWPNPYPQLLGLALLLTLAGWIDDRFSLPVVPRFAVYAAVAIAGVLIVDGDFPWWCVLAVAFGSLWMINLFNFMDGIDGIAATQAGFVCVASASLSAFADGSEVFALFCALIGAACAGFLFWNWAPAKLFIGDTGAIPLGFLIAMLAVLGWRHGSLPLAASLILSAAFIADASVTLIMRMLRGENVAQAHSQHLYQRLSRYWHSHSRVVAAMLAFNVLWLLPLAVAATLHPGVWWLWLPAAYLPLLLLLVKTGKLP